MNMIDWNGGECPVQGRRVVRVTLRDGCTITDTADTFRWDHKGYADADIIAYRLVDEDLAVTPEEDRAWQEKEAQCRSDGSTASYYELPEGCKELQDLISYRNMNAQIGEIQRAVYRYGQASHSDQLRDAKKIRFYIEAEIERLERYGA